jgi:para-aminobenzoate synthetase/4-amino-4-deoxychorismate lyase
LFGVGLPTAEIEAAAAAVAAGLELGRMLIELAPDEDGVLTHRVSAAPIDPEIFFPSRERGAELRSVVVPGWSGVHKWSDRPWLERTERQVGAGSVPLVVDAEGRVLEAGRANVFAVSGGVLRTPPTDGSILAGTARAALMELAAELGIEVEEEALTLADLRNADEVFLTSSLRGVRPARLLDDEPLGDRGQLSARLGEELQRRWLSG